MTNKKPKPLFTIGKRPRAEVHRARFRPFESLMYLNLPALKKANKARIEIGRIEGGGMEATIVAEFRRGMITDLKPLACKGCGEEARRGRTSRSAAGSASGKAVRKVAREALERIRDRGYPILKLPIRVATKLDLEIPIGPIIIVFGPGIDVCVVIEWPDGEICIYCLFSSGLCVGPIVVE